MGFSIAHAPVHEKFRLVESREHVIQMIVDLSCTIALFTVTFSHLHYNVFERGCEAISGNFALFARNCLTFTFKCIVMQMRKGNCEKGYSPKKEVVIAMAMLTKDKLHVCCVCLSRRGKSHTILNQLRKPAKLLSYG